MLFFGTPRFALPTLERLAAGPHAPVAVVSQPDRPRGRGRANTPSPVAARALELGLPLLRPERIAAPDVIAAMRSHAPELGVVVAFGQFLTRAVRELPARGYLINAHASLLPRHRGAAPIAHALLAGDTETGVSVMRVEKEMDAGPVLLARAIAIEPDETAGALGERLAEVSADAIAEALERIAAGRAEWTAQDARRATFAPKIERADTWIDWSEPARSIANRVRALAPAPGARAEYEGEMLRILAARWEAGRADAPPGSVRRDARGGLRIATGEGWLVPQRLQRSGGKPLDAADYLRGRPIPDGARLLGASDRARHC